MFRRPLSVTALALAFSVAMPPGTPTAGVAIPKGLAQDPAEQPPTAAEKRVRKLLELTGASRMGKDVLDRMLAQFQGMPGLPEGFIEKFKELAKPDELIDKVIPIYLEHLDEATLDAAIQFAETPAGNKFFAAQPGISRAAMQVGIEWGQKLAQQVQAQVAVPVQPAQQQKKEPSK